MGPSHGTTRSVLLLTAACFQSACVATRTRSAPRKGRRCERGCAELRGGRPVTTLRRPGLAGSLGVSTHEVVAAREPTHGGLLPQSGMRSSAIVVLQPAGQYARSIGR